MSLFSALGTAVSGMSAQSSYLSAIGDNIANANTTGYKEAATQFETVLGEQTPGSYESGGVSAQTTYGVTTQGTMTATSSSTDLAINGGGFFVVTQGGTGAESLTRAGSFTKDTTGNLVNTAGYTLMGYAIGADGTPSTTLTAVNISSTKLEAVASTTGTISGNLPSTDTSSSSPETTTATLYDSSGTAITADLSYQNNGDGTWTVTATNAADTSPIGSATLSFDSSGQYAGGSPLVLTIPQSAGSTATNTVSLDLTSMTSLASTFSSTPDITGSPPTSLSTVSIGTDGTLTGIYGSGAKAVLYDIPIATVTSPNNLTSVDGNVYQQSATSGSMTLQPAGTGAAGEIDADNLESSTVDLATELTNMITAQRSYEANSKVLQAASDLLSKLNQLQTS
ncbi:flagellar hook protein FlgE [Beijerinckia sp. L45]|uniref:flagellar hook protein FlgE n=1 Tax=Beijerinckia sp. L45 TaxID=1641855 RepID=UPI00131AA770|nr:flagellar hook protein FlgE [Beijerinckia sp. L45]